jgi:hypothetical protein
LRKSTTSLPSFLDRNLDSVNINQAQGNRISRTSTFAASRLAGTGHTARHLVFQDGVRINEPFGDSVNWDLLRSRPSPTSR